MKQRITVEARTCLTTTGNLIHITLTGKRSVCGKQVWKPARLEEGKRLCADCKRKLQNRVSKAMSILMGMKLEIEVKVKEAEGKEAYVL